MKNYNPNGKYPLKRGDSPNFDLYIAQDLIQPGDVLLTRSSQKESTLIAVPTKGPFSHAALIINSSHTFEARSNGIGYKALVTHRIEKQTNKPLRLSRLDETEVAIVLRHHRLSIDYKSDELSDKLMKIVSPFYGLEYPEFCELAKAVSSKKLIQQISFFILRALDFWKNNKKINPGPFCSQLIALIYSEINIPLFPYYLTPESVSPNKLIRSSLRPVEGAICILTTHLPTMTN